MERRSIDVDPGRRKSALVRCRTTVLRHLPDWHRNRLKGLPEAINTVCDRAVVQTCIVHVIRNTFRFAARQYWDEMSRDLRPVYTAPSEAAAKERFVDFSGKWGQRYPAITRLWENEWSEFVPFLGLRRGNPAGHLQYECH
ncbi:transposase [Arthrobacter sp. ISL-48]|nr:transposase [Arthrobacter sp. ISL-48]